MKNLVTYVQDRLEVDAVGEEIILDPNGINAEYFDDGDEFPSIGRTYEIAKVHSDEEGNPISIDIKEKGTEKTFENYGIDNFKFRNGELNKFLYHYLKED